MKSKKSVISKSVKSKPNIGKVNPVVHFEMPADDRVRMSKFYKGAFGWKTKMLGEKMGNYVLATTTD